MKITQTRWYSVTLIVCLTLFLLMVYRREARMRAHIEGLESRIESLEQYIRGGQAIVSVIDESEETVESPAPQPAPRTYPKKTATAKPLAQASDTTIPAQEEERREGKFRQVVRLELNTIDSATLVRVPGIGEGIARNILQYRERLGGYYSTDQLREKLTWEGAQPYLDQWCNEWFWVDGNLIQKLQINKLQFKELLRHPYLDYEDVKAIVKWRDRYKSVQKEADLRQLWPSDSTKLEKLLHYVEF